ncbi:NucA/NucB deoxyribonuclease domain-containing protein [Streptomyces sp. NPDC002690]
MRADGLSDANRRRTCEAGSSDPFVTRNDLVPNDSCDEFPFAGTFEGGTDGALCADIMPLFENGQWVLYEARQDKPVTFTEPCIRAHVSLSANSSAGGVYGSLVKTARILDTEKFYVDVVS